MHMWCIMVDIYYYHEIILSLIQHLHITYTTNKNNNTSPAHVYYWQVGIEVSFLQWMMVSVPFTIVGTFISWVLICLVIQPDDVKYIPVVVFDRERDDFSKRNITVTVLSMLVVVMFSVFPWIQPLLGDIAMVSMCYIIFMFGSGMLSEVSK